MRVIGIVGGVASGKSTVTDCLARLGAAVLNADQIGHDVLRQPEVIAALVDRWGPGILSADGQINRSAVAKIVFAPDGKAEKGFLEGVSHPRIAAAMRSQIDQWRKQGTVPYVAVDAAIMLETGWSKFCDEIWFVDAPSEIRKQRAIGRGWTPDQWTAREKSQWPLERKREAATHFVDNSRSPDETCRQVALLLQKTQVDRST